MSDPTVVCVMLTADRHELAQKAIACFLRQTYEKKALLIYDTGNTPLSVEHPQIAHAVLRNNDATAQSLRTLPIGALRNNANGMATADILIHWDDDDWSHPNRIAEQVALLEGSGAECVGYNEMLFWRDGFMQHLGKVKDPYGPGMLESAQIHPGESWLYTNERSNYALGTSLCYWRKTWEAKQFRDDLPKPNSTGEDHDWIQGMNLHAVPSIVHDPPANLIERINNGEDFNPRMIARIHGGNSSSQYQNIANSNSWKRVPEWDERVRELLG